MKQLHSVTVLYRRLIGDPTPRFLGGMIAARSSNLSLNGVVECSE